MALFPFALEDDLRTEVRAPGHHHQARDAIKRCGHPVGIELVAHHGHLTVLHAHAALGHHQRKGQGLGRPVQVGKAQLLGKRAHPLFGPVGHDGELYTRAAHGVQPPGHLLRQLLAAVGREGVVDIQYQRGDALCRQPFRRDVGDILENIFGGNEHK